MRFSSCALLLVLLAHCAPPPPPVEPPTLVLAPPVEPVASAESSAAPSAAPAPTATIAPAAPEAPAVPAACQGADLDLDVIDAHHDCDVGREAQAAPGPDLLGVELTPAQPRVKPGGKLVLTASIVNKSDRPLTVDVNVSCGKDFALEVQALDAKGERADRVGRDACA